MGKAIAPVTDADLAKDCLLKWWEVARFTARWWRDIERLGEKLGPPYRTEDESAEDFGKRYARGLLTISQEGDD